MKKKIFNLFKEYAYGEITENFLTGSLNVIIKDKKIMFRFDDSTVLYTYNDIIRDMHYNNNNNKLFLIEQITNAVNNNNIEII